VVPNEVGPWCLLARCAWATAHLGPPDWRALLGLCNRYTHNIDRARHGYGKGPGRQGAVTRLGLGLGASKYAAFTLSRIQSDATPPDVLCVSTPHSSLHRGDTKRPRQTGVRCRAYGRSLIRRRRKQSINREKAKKARPPNAAMMMAVTEHKE